MNINLSASSKTELIRSLKGQGVELIYGSDHSRPLGISNQYIADIANMEELFEAVENINLREWADTPVKRIRYDITGASKSGVRKHPQAVVQDLGMQIHDAEANTTSDCWIMIVSQMPDDLPNYIEILDNIPAIS